MSSELQRVYWVWKSMRQRCNNSLNAKYPLYGEKGITVCERWNSFALFLEDMGRRPTPLHTLDRIEAKENYEPRNCKWSTLAEQAAVGRRTWKTTTHGITGISWHKRSKRWQAKVQNKLLYWGTDFFEACCARKSWEAENATPR